MRTIIAGSRSITDPAWLDRALAKCGWTPTVVLSGTAPGADRLGERWANYNYVPIERYPADWNTHGKRAGFLRNTQMAEHADALIALWDNVSPGTQHMIAIATRLGLRLHVEQPHVPRLYNRLNGPVAPLDTVYIGRPSKWANPYVIDKHGTREEVIERYRLYLVLNPELYVAAKRELRGKDLVCFCAPEACHGDVLLEIANES
jgi:hypothetical protein